MTDERFKPPLQLSGEDGNAYFIMGRARRVLERAVRDGKLPEGTVEEYTKEAESGDYDHLLQTTMRYCDVS